MRATLTAITLSAAALAAQAEPATGGFKGPDAVALVTVAEAIEMGDDSPVKIQGHIVKALGDETYEFQDESGILVVEIDDEEWGSLEVEPTDRVELRGEIDKDLQKTDLEVDHIRLVQ